jgi:hypothetical protein
MAQKIVPHKSGKGFIVTGRPTVKEWEETLRTAGGCVGVTSVNHRAERARQKEQEDKDPTRQGRRD